MCGYKVSLDLCVRPRMYVCVCCTCVYYICACMFVFCDCHEPKAVEDKSDITV